MRQSNEAGAWLVPKLLDDNRATGAVVGCFGTGVFHVGGDRIYLDDSHIIVIHLEYVG